MLMLSMPPATTTSAEPARRRSLASIAAFMPEPHILLTVVAPAAMRQPGADRRLARRRLALARRQHAAHQDFVDAFGRDIRPFDRGGDRPRPQRRGGDVLQVAEKAAHRRARRADDDDGVFSVHGPCLRAPLMKTLSRRAALCRKLSPP